MLNQVTLMGRLTADPELKQTQSGVAYANVSLAVERDYKDKSTGKRPVDFINIAAWKGTAELLSKYFKKGSLILIVGSIQVRNYQDKNGNNRVAVEVLASSVHFTGEKSGNTQGSNNQAPAAPQQAAQGFNMPNPADFEDVEYDDDDLPF